MTDPFEYLVGEFGPSWGSPPGKYAPGNYSSGSVNWAEAVEIYDFAKRYLEREELEPEHQAQTAAIISVLTERFVDGLPPSFRQMLLESVGEEEGDA